MAQYKKTVDRINMHKDDICNDYRESVPISDLIKKYHLSFKNIKKFIDENRTETDYKNRKEIQKNNKIELHKIDQKTIMMMKDMLDIGIPKNKIAQAFGVYRNKIASLFPDYVNKRKK
jgi:hypothetical protein